jgi:signal transduction histidine kinase
LKTPLRFQSWPLFWKLLLPFMTLMILMGAFGVFVIVRDLSTRADATLEQDLARRSLDAQSLLRDRELFLIESTNLASNLEGMPTAIKKNDSQTTARLLQSVMALKPALGMAVATDAKGVGLVEFSRGSAPDQVTLGKANNWSAFPFVGQALGDTNGNKFAGFLTAGERKLLAIAAPVCSAPEACAPVGVAITGVVVEQLAAVAGGKRAASTSPASESPTGVALFDESGRLLSSNVQGGVIPVPKMPGATGRETRRVGSTEFATLYSPFEVQGRRVGTLAVTIPTEPVMSTVRAAALRLSLVVLLAMFGAVAVGAVLSKAILRQVSGLLETNRALGRGELAARAPVGMDDELGELARGVNQMAEQLQASYETLELRVTQRTEEVQRLLKERTEFFTSLSHELRTPLAVILGEVKLMQDPTYRNHEGWVGETSRKLGYSAQQLLSLVNEVLDLARMEKGTIEVTPKPVDVREILNELRPTIDGLARGSSLEMELRFPRQLPRVKADKARLREVILNLIDNAVKYTPEGGKVGLSATARNGHVEISVSDNGVGIPEESTEMLFEPFYQVPGVIPLRGQPSSGLGLAVTKRLVEAQGGTIRFVSKPGAGSTFTFTVPRTNPQSFRREK